MSYKPQFSISPRLLALPRGVGAELDLDADTPELEAEQLKAVRGPFTPYSRQNLEAIAERIRREKAA